MSLMASMSCSPHLLLFDKPNITRQIVFVNPFVSKSKIFFG
nr:MAG TPA: hypothetical protein [Caudoviricetes sp.]